MGDRFRVCLCMHLHQPNFQLPTVKEQVYRLSYVPWLDLVERASFRHPGRIAVSFHVSGSLLFWLSRHHPDWLARMRELVERGVVRPVGGLIDESFPQLSRRPDDLLFQAREYGELLAQTLGCGPEQWDGFHIVEREASERHLAMVARAAVELGFPPIVYLDAETFFPYRGPEPAEDLARVHYGSSSSGSRTTFPGLPTRSLHGLFRDEIGGFELFVAPIHSAQRYFFLKWRTFAGDDRIVEGAEFARELSLAARETTEWLPQFEARGLPPLLLVFNDGELFGQWSGDPARDTLWMDEFFEELLSEPERRLIGLAEYREHHDYVDTYPTKSSSSYVEFENWTGRRGIRGANWADPKLRTLLTLARDVEARLDRVDRDVLDDAKKTVPIEFVRSVLDSPTRGDVIASWLGKSRGEVWAEGYRLVRRLLSTTYEADSHWATRHPDYGSSSCCDLTQASYLALATRLIRELQGEEPTRPTARDLDWNHDGVMEVVLENRSGMVIVSALGASVLYHQAHGDSLIEASLLDLVGLARRVHLERPSFPSVGLISQCVALTETDSDLVTNLGQGSARLEHCRNGFRTTVERLYGPSRETIGSFDKRLFDIVSTRSDADLAEAVLTASDGGLAITKTFRLVGARLQVAIEIERRGSDGRAPGGLVISPELISTIVPADDVDNLLDVSVLAGATNGGRCECSYEIHNVGQDGHGPPPILRMSSWPLPGRVSVATRVNTRFARFRENIRYTFDDETRSRLVAIKVQPAVSRFYEGYVSALHQSLGYHQSGVMIKPSFFVDGMAKVRLNIEVARLPVSLDENREEIHCLDLIRRVP